MSVARYVIELLESIENKEKSRFIQSKKALIKKAMIKKLSEASR